MASPGIRYRSGRTISPFFCVSWRLTSRPGVTDGVNGIQEVRGSIPLGSTSEISRLDPVSPSRIHHAFISADQPRGDPGSCHHPTGGSARWSGDEGIDPLA